MTRKIEPVRRSLRRHGSRTFTEVARLVPSGSRSVREKPRRWSRWRVRRTDCRAGGPLVLQASALSSPAPSQAPEPVVEPPRSGHIGRARAGGGRDATRTRWDKITFA